MLSTFHGKIPFICSILHPIKVSTFERLRLFLCFEVMLFNVRIDLKRKRKKSKEKNQKSS